ncbi:polyketide synthase [Hortaea werneckii]|nr:polyketide synthase [Hortaea werneckii]KAI6846427.1 polyketide synthase [Hortaea werneckii]
MPDNVSFMDESQDLRHIRETSRTSHTTSILNVEGDYRNNDMPREPGECNRSTNGTVDHERMTPSADGGIPIAICGIGLRLPGGIRNDRDLYDSLYNKKDARGVIPEDRFSIDSFHSAHGKTGTIITKHGYFLQDIDLTKFDVNMFNMTPAEVERLDPHQRILLETVRETLESAGEASFRGKKVGTYVGNFTDDWLDLQNVDTVDFATYQLHGKMDFSLANRISYEYDLRGPSMTIKTACSSSALAIHEAVYSIRNGECDAAIVSGSNLNLAPRLWVGMSSQGAISPDGSSKTFDESANGYARGDGIAALFIKRLDDAVRDGNPVRAVIRSTASNADGRTPGMTMPSTEAQEALIRRAYDAANLPLSETAMVECHGTGTAVGDPMEANAVARCFGDQGMLIGSVKPNLGHSEGASAITSVVKAVLSLENRTILPNIKFHRPNPAIPWSEAKLTVPVEPLAWPKDRQERISVNSFGIGGSNVHVVLDSAASMGFRPRSLAPSKDDRPGRLLLFSGGHRASVEQSSSQHQDYVTKYPNRLSDVAYTLAKRPPVKCPGLTRSTFVFTGQGAQWLHMGKELLHESPVFAKSIGRMDSVIHSLKHAPQWTLEGIINDPENPSALTNAEISQPLCTAVQIGLVDLLKSWAIYPHAVLGHSSGEIGAAYASGVVDRAEAILLAFYRGYVCRFAQKAGGMAAVGLEKSQVIKYLQPGVCVACENSGSSVTLSGDLETLEEVLQSIRAENLNAFARKLQVGIAYHSDHMKALGGLYHQYITEHLDPKDPQVPFFSSVSGRALHSKDDFGATYWQDNLENPVLFHTAVLKSLEHTGDKQVHLEVGPHGALNGPLRQIYAETGSKARYVALQKRGANCFDTFLEGIGQLYCNGVPLQYPESADDRTLIDLPPYPWHYDHSYWSETRVMKNWRFRRQLPHDLLGLRTLDCSDAEPMWRNILRITDLPWLRDHCVGKDVVFPASGYMCMAGEAVFQETGCRDYTLREVDISTAMVLSSDHSTELLTTMKKRRLNAFLDSRWYEFLIMSYDGASWTQHCSGLVTNGPSTSHPKALLQTYDRPVSTNRWYTAMSKIGLNYGPRFTGLQNITTHVQEKKASMTIMDKQEDYESPYALHPSTLDLILQSWTVASVRGEYRRFTQLFLPTFVDEFYIGNSASKLIHLNTTAIGPDGSARGEAIGKDNDGQISFNLKGFKGSKLDNVGVDQPQEMQTIMKQQWKRDFDFADTAQLMRPAFDSTSELSLLERMFVLAAIEVHVRTSGMEGKLPHHQRYKLWIDAQIRRFGEPGYPMVEDSMELLRLDSRERQRQLCRLLEHSRKTTAHPVAEAIWRALDRIEDVFDGRIEYLDLLFNDGLMPKFYDWSNSLSDVSRLFRLLSHKKPQLKILEVGAGTGGSTARLLQYLQSDFGERQYHSYTYTDVSSGFFVQAQERFKDYEGMKYRVLDISQDPFEQGFGADEFDLICASNVLHATPRLTETLRNCRKMLRPDGILFLQELCPRQQFMGFIMGLFEGWWLGAEDGRADTPLLLPPAWDRRLRDVGFEGVEAFSFDNNPPYFMAANMTARPTVTAKSKGSITLLTFNDFLDDVAGALKQAIRAAGFEIDHCVWGEHVPLDQSLISLVDLERDKPLLQDIGDDDLRIFLDLIDAVLQTTVIWLNKPAQVSSADPNAAQMLGLARTLRAELAMHFATVEMADPTLNGMSAVVHLMCMLQRGSALPENSLDQDMEYVWAHDAMHVSRFHFQPVDEALMEMSPKFDVKTLVPLQRGMLSSLKWIGTRMLPLAEAEVQIRMSAVGMNFHDMMIAMNMFDSPLTLGSGYNSIGMEGVGYVTRKSPEVDHVQVGDRVIVIGSNSSGFATDVHRPADYCIKCPSSLTDVEAAGMSFAYMTVLWSFLDKGGLRKGQSVLIHSAAGGVGIAALHVSRWLGLEAFVTVGNEEKVRFIMNNFGLPRNRIFNSHSATFLDDVMDATAGRGVDAALSAAAGELLHNTWSCIAPGGVMLEIGKRDLINRGRLSLAPFEENRSYVGIDFSRLTIVNKPAVVRLLRQTMRLVEQGHIHPIHPTTCFDAEHAEDAFRFMQTGQHIGRIVVKIPRDTSTIPLASRPPAPEFEGQKTYLLVGGMGGLGRSVASWMVSAGARNLIFMSRSAGKSEQDQNFARELELSGCKVHCCAIDITDTDAVREALERTQASVAGVLQMAMVLRDVGIMNMDKANWDAAVAPKVQGTWNLHHALPNVDFFVMFRSNSGTLGSYGQANYAAANAFLDSFVQYRQNLGQAASVIDIGAVGDVGYVAETQVAAENMESMAGRLISEQDFLNCLQLAIARSTPTERRNKGPSTEADGYIDLKQVILLNSSILSMADPSNQIFWRKDPRMGIYRNVQRTSAESPTTDSNSLRRLVATLKADSSIADQAELAQTLARELSKQVATVLMLGEDEIDVDRSLTDVGMDSLVAIEMRNWWKQNLGVDVSVLELKDGRSILRLGELAATRLKERYSRDS